MILGLQLCPFAQPVAQRNGLKVVSSTGATGDEVMEDLVLEANMYRQVASGCIRLHQVAQI